MQLKTTPTAQAIALAARDYRIVIDHTVEAPGVPDWIARYPDLPGCMSEGYSAVEAVRDLGFASFDYIQFMLDNGLDVPEPTPGPAAVIMQVSATVTGTSVVATVTR